MKHYVNVNDNHFGGKEELKDVCKSIDLDKVYVKGGVPLYSDTKEMLVSTQDNHSLIIGTTGARKTRSLVVPMICNIAGAATRQSMIVHDTKGEVSSYCYNYLIENGYDVFILNFRDPSCSDHYNPFVNVINLMKKDRKKSQRKLNDITNQLFSPFLVNEKDPYWLNTTSQYFMSLIEGFAILSKYNVKYNNFYNYINFHRKFCMNRSNTILLESFFEDVGRKDIIEGIDSVHNNASETKKNLLSMVSAPFELLESVGDITSKSDFDAVDLACKPTALFIVTPDEDDSYNFIVSLIIKEIYAQLIDFASSCENKTLPITVNFIIDEFSSLPKLTNFNSMISAARSRNMRFHLIIQTFSQLRMIYKEFGATNILNNCGNLIVLRNNDPEIEAILRNSVGKFTLPYSGKEVEGISSGCLRSLKKGQAIIIVEGVKNPIMSVYPDMSEYKCFDFEQEASCLNEKKKCSVKYFDFEKHLMLWKRKKRKAIETAVNEIGVSQIIDEFDERQKKMKDYHKQKRPVLITKNIMKLSYEPYDIVIQSVKYGFEKSLYKVLLDITHVAEKDVAVAVMNLSDDGDDILLKCPSKTQFNKVKLKLKNVAKFSCKASDSDSGLDLPLDLRIPV